MKRDNLIHGFSGVLAVALLAVACWTWGCDDDGSSCPPSGMSACDPVSQSCCEEGLNCVLYWDSRGSYLDACLGGDGEVGEGAPCTANVQTGAQACLHGLSCMRTGTDVEAVCHRLCFDDGDCNGGSCSVELPGVSVRACE